MANDADWVEDVRRWYLSGASAVSAATDDGEDSVAIGYEAADPALQARHWPDAPAAGKTDAF